LYVRVSSKEQEQGFSISAQRLLLTEYARSQGIRILQEFEDIETAKRAGRKSFSDMIAFLRSNPSSCRTVLVEKTDRLYRNIKDWVTVDELGIEVHFVQGERRPLGRLALLRKVHARHQGADGEELHRQPWRGSAQGHDREGAPGPLASVAPVGYRNNPVTHRIEPDPERAPIVAKLFEWYASGEYSLKALTKMAATAGLTNRTGGKPLVKAKIHQLLKNPIYYGEFYWLGQLHAGAHTPIISRALFERVQDVFTAANRPRHTKRRHAFAGLVTCARCGCAFTAETKKGQYIYYHCTGHRGPCGNTYVREEELAKQFGDILRQVRIPAELAGKLATVLRESQTDREKFARTSLLRLQQQQVLLRSKLDRVYEDRLGDKIRRNSGARNRRSCKRTAAGADRDGAPRGRGRSLRAGRPADSRTRAKRLFVLRCAESARTGAPRQNGCIERDVRSRKSFSRLH